MSIPSSSGMLKRGNALVRSSSVRERSWMEYRQAPMISIILWSRTSPEFRRERAHIARKPQAWIVKTIASNIGVYASSNGQLMKTLLSYAESRLRLTLDLSFGANCLDDITEPLLS